MWRGGRRLPLVPTRANRQPAFACYITRPDEDVADAAGVIVLTISGDRISGITRFLDTGLHRLFGLPETIGRSPAAGWRSMVGELSLLGRGGDRGTDESGDGGNHQSLQDAVVVADPAE